MLVSDRKRLAGRALADVVRDAAQAGVDDVQIREKDLGGRALGALVRELQAAVEGTEARLVLNGRVDVACATALRAVQLPEAGLPVSAVKCLFPALTIGASRHSVDGVRQAEGEGADFIVLGPVFATPGKEERALGLAALEEAARAVSVPIYAIGGVEPRRARDLVAAGARGLALIRPFLDRPAKALVAELRAALA
jgi:thiamine-phosphate pyrophosphorylase